MKYALITITTLLLVGCNNAQPFITEATTTEITEKIVQKSEDHGSAESYTGMKLEVLKESGKAFAVFVGADWCPGCVILSKDIEANQSQLPKGTVILIANFDTDIELRKPYSVTTKHTGIFFDNEGNYLNSKAGVTFDDFTEHLAQYN